MLKGDLLMSEEKFEKSEKECKCFCQSKYFKKFLVVALGSFVGVYLALCLFAACHKPPCAYNGGFGGHQKFDCPCKKHKNPQFSESNMRPEFQNDMRKPHKRPRPDED